MKGKSAAVLAIVIALSACLGERGPEGPPDPASATMDFGFGLMELLGPGDENAFFSPYGISAAFALAGAGARGETAAGIAGALGLGGDPEDIPAAFGEIERSLEERREPGKFELSSANAAWIQEDYPVKESYLKAAAEHFRAEAKRLDLAGDPAGAAADINRWVSDKTAGNIDELISPRALDAYTRLVLTNAVYFNAAWAFPFDPDDTRELEFRLPGRETAEVPMMRREGYYSYSELGGAKLLEIPYEGSGVSMLLVLPREGGPEPGADTVRALAASAETANVRVTVPLFRFETEYGLTEPMKSLGAGAAFDPDRADFTGISEEGDLHIQEALHKARIDVTEEGTEAAAATAIIMGVTAAPGIPEAEFTADRPFLFLIRDGRTGAVLFMGRVADPRGEETGAGG